MSIQKNLLLAAVLAVWVAGWELPERTMALLEAGGSADVTWPHVTVGEVHVANIDVVATSADATLGADGVARITTASLHAAVGPGGYPHLPQVVVDHAPGWMGGRMHLDSQAPWLGVSLGWLPWQPVRVEASGVTVDLVDGALVAPAVRWNVAVSRATAGPLFYLSPTVPSRGPTHGVACTCLRSTGVGANGCPRCERNAGSCGTTRMRSSGHGAPNVRRTSSSLAPSSERKTGASTPLVGWSLVEPLGDGWYGLLDHPAEHPDAGAEGRDRCPRRGDLERVAGSAGRRGLGERPLEDRRQIGPTPAHWSIGLVLVWC